MRPMKTVLTWILPLIMSQAWAGYHHPSATYTANGPNYDVVYDRISLNVNPGTSKTITAATVTTWFKTTANNVSSLQFDLDCTSMTVSAASYHGSAVSFTTSTAANVLTLTIPTIPLAGTLDSVTIKWSGTPVTPGSPVPSGYNYGTHNSTQKVIFTLGESFTGHTWWPCKESLDDKIDSVDLIVTAPNTFKVSGNGVVAEVASGSNTITTWKTRYATATYGVNFAVANFSVSSSSLNVNGKTINLMNYLFPEDVSNYASSMNDIKAIIPVYSNLFGVDYPFANEKYGMTECSGNWGALEVQTMTFMSRGSGTGYSKYTIAHELSHQWFGDMITTNTWHMVWLNEGFAQYCESVIYPEHLDAANLSSRRASLKSAVTTTSTVYVHDTTSANSIFAGSDQPYEKGAMFLSMMRTWLGDARFFAAIKNYLTSRVQYGFTSVDTLQKYMQAQSSLNMSNFFNSWLYQKGYAKYNVQWSASNKQIVIQLQQSPTTAGSGYFDMPVPIEILGSGLDTTVVIIDKGGVLYNSATGATTGTNRISFTLSATPASIRFDPQNLVLATGTTAASIILPVNSMVLNGVATSSGNQLTWSIHADEKPGQLWLEKSWDGEVFGLLCPIDPSLTERDGYRGVYLDSQQEDIQYYRLKAVQHDGQLVYSNLIKLTGTVRQTLKIGPNPAHQELCMWVPSTFHKGSMSLWIQNAAGQIIAAKTYSAFTDDRLPIGVNGLLPGMYYIVVMNDKKERLQTGFIKQ
jgi:aminopeptidase N